MAKTMLILVAVSVLAGLLARAVWGGYAGAGALAAVLVTGALAVVLRRNQEDLHELEAGRVPPEVDRALGHAPPPE
jgi:hypothetical protein